MSIAALAVRICTTYALRGRTIAGANIADSPMNPLPENISAVHVAIYSGVREIKACGTDLFGGDHSMNLSINVHLPSKFDAQGTAGPVGMQARDAGAEAAFDMFWRQASSALMNDESVWADLWREFVTDIKSVDSVPFLIELEARTRVAARDFSFELDTINDPPAGAIDSASPWRRFIDACAGEPELAAFVPVLVAAIETPTAVHPARASVGLSYSEFVAVGLAPIATGTLAPVDEITVEDDQAGDFVITSATPDPGPSDV